MKTKSNFLFSAFAAMLLLVATTHSYALNYTISFTASGITSSVGSVQVQNLSKGTTATIPSGNTLTLTDQTTVVDDLSANNDGIRISQNINTGTSTLTFYADQAGSTELVAYALDGRKVVGQITHLEVGDNSAELSLPTGMYAIRVLSARHVYSTKMQSLGSVCTQAKIKFLSNEKAVAIAPQKSIKTPIATTTMSYTTGDQLLYTATSGTYIVSVPDVPIANKTINFVFSTIPTSAIPAGTFTMGSSTTEVSRHSDETQYAVTLSAFSMSKYEITNAQYAIFLNAKSIGSDGLYAVGAYPTQALISANTSRGLVYKDSKWVSVVGSETSPVIVTWYGATEFATYMGGTLPTEAQWEYACRAGTTTPFCTGNCLTNLQANYVWSIPYSSCINNVTIYPDKAQPIGTYAANDYGLYDMHGNIAEWCADWYGIYPTTAQANPIGSTTGLNRVVRGGGWFDYAQDCRSSARSYCDPRAYIEFIGFRIVFVR